MLTAAEPLMLGTFSCDCTVLVPRFWPVEVPDEVQQDSRTFRQCEATILTTECLALKSRAIEHPRVVSIDCKEWKSKQPILSRQVSHAQLPPPR